jgi:hypothetical protein
MKNDLSPRTAGMHRREFLVLSSTAVAGIAATGVSASTSGALTVLKGASPVLSIGFAENAGDEPQQLVAADRLQLNDSHFHSTGARVTVHGLWRPESRRAKAEGVALTAFFTNGEQRVPFLAWSGVAGAPVTFRMPVDASGSLPIAIERNRTASVLAEPARRFASFFTGPRTQAAELPNHDALEQRGSICRLVTSGGGLKLRRGTYFIALREHSWESAPNWSSISLADGVRNVKRESILRRGNAPVDFEYLTVSVDYA